ncbi:MAG: hypothetical protein JWL75_518 [Parcubacteria group bacterium]|nr:hypothetical protein [Parcubacteria group bacterium]
MNEDTRHTLVAASRPVRIAAAAALGMLALFLLVKTFDAISLFGQGDTPQVNTITVSGTGTSSATPDIAKISFTVQESASTVQAAQTAATKKTNDAIAAMKALGVAEKDIKTAAYTVNPQYASRPVTPCYGGTICPAVATVVNANTITGYQVSESVDVTVRDTAKASDVVTKLGALGVQNVSGPNFSVDDDSGVMNDARAEAIKNAQKKAEELAKELGVSLAGVVSYSDQGNTYPMYDKAISAQSMSSGAPQPNLPTGTDDRTVNVQVTYRIK